MEEWKVNVLATDHSHPTRLSRGVATCFLSAPRILTALDCIDLLLLVNAIIGWSWLQTEEWPSATINILTLISFWGPFHLTVDIFEAYLKLKTVKSCHFRKQQALYVGHFWLRCPIARIIILRLVSMSRTINKPGLFNYLMITGESFTKSILSRPFQSKFVNKVYNIKSLEQGIINLIRRRLLLRHFGSISDRDNLSIWNLVNLENQVC